MRNLHKLTTFLFLLYKIENALKTNQQQQTNHEEIATKLLNPRLKNWNDMSNVVILLF
jgi:cell pole-organizing protein PopZ